MEHKSFNIHLSSSDDDSNSPSEESSPHNECLNDQASKQESSSSTGTQTTSQITTPENSESDLENIVNATENLHLDSGDFSQAQADSATATMVFKYGSGFGAIQDPGEAYGYPAVTGETSCPLQVPIAAPPPPDKSYPLVYVSPGGLLTVLLKHDMAVEMTTDRTIRVVNNRHTSAASINARGSSAAIFHCGAKIYQTGTTTEAHLFWERRARMQTEGFTFACGDTCYEYVFGRSDNIQITHPNFQDLSKDMTVTLLFSSSQYGPHFIEQYNEVASQAKYMTLDNGGFLVFVNETCIQQEITGEVTVLSGPKMIHMSPITGTVRLETHFVKIAVDDWLVQVQRCGHKLLASTEDFLLTNGNVEVGFDQNHRVKFRVVGAVLEVVPVAMIEQDPAILTCIPESFNVPPPPLAMWNPQRNYDRGYRKGRRNPKRHRTAASDRHQVDDSGSTAGKSTDASA